MTETERAAEITRGPRKRFMQNIIMVAALLLAMVALGTLWHDLQQRAETAETSMVSLAEQVQHACDSQGSLDLDGRDLCQQADDVVEDPATARVPADGRNGRDGIDGTDGTDGIDGKDGRPGKDGKNGLPGTDGIDGTDGQNGADATPVDGEDGTDGVDGTNGADGKDGADGTDGADGAPGRGFVEVECLSTGDWVFTFDDGVATTVPGPCRVALPTPTPTPTTTKK